MKTRINKAFENFNRVVDEYREFQQLGDSNPATVILEDEDIIDIKAIYTPDIWGQVTEGLDGVKIIFPEGCEFSGGLYLGKKGTEFGAHKHSEQDEYIHILEGEFLERRTNTVYKKGDVLKWEKGEVHHVIYLSDCLYFVYFRPPMPYIKNV